MPFLALPAELRLAIFAFVPGLNSNATNHIRLSAYAIQTPAISRTCKLLRRETLPLFAQDACLYIDLPQNMAYRPDWTCPLPLWANSLDTLPLSRLKLLQLRRDWDSPGASGFLLSFVPNPHRLSDSERAPWLNLDVGTYPVSHDRRGMRLESTALLRRAVQAFLRLRQEQRSSCPLLLRAEDLAVVAQVMDIVAQHPISVYDLDQDDSGRQNRRRKFDEMERAVVGFVGAMGVEMERTAFYTAY